VNGPNRTESDQSKPVHPRRARAYALLAGGAGVRATARELKVKHETIIAWRDSEEGQTELRRLGAKLANVREGELVAAEKRLARLTHRAVDTLGELLESDDEAVRLRAATAIADRGGLPKTERVELPEQVHDYSDLTDEELATLRRAQEIRARKKGAGG